MDYTVSDLAIEIAKAITIIGVLGAAWKIAIWVVGLIVG